MIYLAKDRPLEFKAYCIVLESSYLGRDDLEKYYRTITQTTVIRAATRTVGP